MTKEAKITRRKVRVKGRLQEVVTIHDDEGAVLHRILRPLSVEFHFHDLVQLVVGATLLAIPVGFTEEVWMLGATISHLQAFALMVISVLFITVFVYYNNYRGDFYEHRFEFLKRVLATYIVAFAVVGLILSVIGKAPWTTDFILAIKRVVLVTLPAAMSAAVTDMIKPE